MSKPLRGHPLQAGGRGLTASLLSLTFSQERSCRFIAEEKQVYGEMLGAPFQVSPQHGVRLAAFQEAGVRGESSGGWRLRSELSKVTAVSWGQVSTWEMGTVSCGCKQGYS